MRKTLVLFACVGVLALALLACGESANTGTAVTSTGTTPDATVAAVKKPSQTHALVWKATHTFTGNGSKKTGTFTIGDDWRIAWSCNPASFNGMDYNMVVFVYAPGGSLVDSGVNSMCKKTNTHDIAEIHTGGQVYLDVTSEGDWTIQVQELK